MSSQLNFHVIKEIFERFKEADPEPKGELNHTNVFTLLVAVALSAQSTDKGVNKATEKLFKFISSPEDMIKLATEKSQEIQAAYDLIKKNRS